VRIQGAYYRGHDPRWSWAATSGEGARLHGGRWNAVGTLALYLASSLEGVIAEMTQGFSNRMEPLTLVQYNVDCEDIVDLTDSGVRATLGIEFSDMSGAWKTLPGDESIPPTWDIADALIDGGAAGILVPSFASDAKPEHHNLVLWDWAEVPPHQVLVHDPDGKLPRDASSWRPVT